MPNTIAEGDIFVQEDVHLPAALLLQAGPDSEGWASVNVPRTTFEKAIQEQGLTFFFMAGEIKTTVFGFDRQKTLGVALKRLINNVKSQHCNSIEITRVTSSSFCSVPCVSVCAHPRHVQVGACFSGCRADSSQPHFSRSQPVPLHD
jgi:hypothetical protein